MVAKNESRHAQPSRWFGVGLLLGLVVGGAAMWIVDWRSFPSSSLDDARKALLVKKPELAEGILKRYVRRFPEDGEAILMLAGTLYAKGEYLSCASRLEVVPESSIWAVESRLLQAQSLHLANFGRRAEQRYLETIDI